MSLSPPTRIRVKSSGSQLPMFVVVVIATFLLTRSGVFASFVDDLAAWGWSSDSTLDDAHLSLPDLDSFADGVEFTIPAPINAAPQHETTGTAGHTTPNEGSQVVDLAVLDPARPSLPLVTSPEDRAQARALIEQVTTAQRGSKTGYDRALFGQSWTDDNPHPTGHNGCDQRNDTLSRDLDGETVKPNTHDCVVMTGTYTSPFSNESHAFTKEQAGDHHVDHIVPLAHAWQMGASQWDDATRTAFQTDPLNLVVVEGSLNQAKSDSDLASWLPAYKDGRCAYSVRFIAVAIKYNLAVTSATKDMALTQCE